MSLMDSAMLINDITPFLLYFCISIILFNTNKIDNSYLIVAIYLPISLIGTFAMMLLGVIYGNNLIVIPLFGLFELSLFFLLYAYFMDLERYRTILYIIFIPAGIFILMESLTIDSANVSAFQSYSRTIDSFIIVVFSMIYFFEKLTKGTDPSDSGLKLNTLILVFFSFNLIFNLPLNFLLGENSQMLKFYFWFIYTCVLFCFYIYLTYAIWKNGKTPKHLRSGSV